MGEWLGVVVQLQRECAQGGNYLGRNCLRLKLGGSCSGGNCHGSFLGENGWLVVQLQGKLSKWKLSRCKLSGVKNWVGIVQVEIVVGVL